MMRLKKKPGDGLFKSVFIAYAIMILNVGVVGVVALLVVLLQGFVSNLTWIFLGFFLLMAGGGYLFYRRMKLQGKNLKETLASSPFRNRPVEISLMGGMLSLRVGGPVQDRQVLEAGDDLPLIELEDPAVMRVRELSSLARMLEDNIITPEEYHRFKEKLFDREDVAGQAM